MPFSRKYEEAVWLELIRMVEAEQGERAIAKDLGIPAPTVRKWISIYRRVGLIGWVAMSTPTKYPFELKLAAVQAFDSGTSRHELLARFEIRNMTQLDNWLSAYRRGGEDALRPKRRGRPARTVASEETVDQKIARLQMENAALKKLHALVVEERRPSSK
jgi:transposase